MAEKIELSTNELRALILKAARGAGFSWGQASEAGDLAIRMIDNGFDAPALFLDLFEGKASVGDQITQLSFDGKNAKITGDQHCPLALCAIMSDLDLGAGQVGISGKISFEPFWHAGAKAIEAKGGHSALRIEITPEQFDTLQAFAFKTYAPENEALRLSGAGAGLTDND